MALIVGGKEIPCAVPVIDWHKSKLEITIGGDSRKRTKAPDLCVWHWWGFEGSIENLWGAFQRRELGSEFSIDAAGTVYQHCDPMLVDSFDAGKANRRSVGIEVQNFGFRAPGQWPKTGTGSLRTTYETTQNGTKRKFAAFFEPQLQSCVALADALSSAIPGIARKVPQDAQGALIERVLSDAELAKFAGHIGHFHIERGKSDPGADLLARVQSSFR
jgi:hypothetical protein